MEEEELQSLCQLSLAWNSCRSLSHTRESVRETRVGVGVGGGVGGVDTHEADHSVFRRQTKIACSQMRMTNVTLSLVVAFLAVLACGGESVRASLDAPSPDGPTIVGEGQDCQETVSPEFQTICAPGLDCGTWSDGSLRLCTRLQTHIHTREHAKAHKIMATLSVASVSVADNF